MKMQALQSIARHQLVIHEDSPEEDIPDWSSCESAPVTPVDVCRSGSPWSGHFNDSYSRQHSIRYQRQHSHQHSHHLPESGYSTGDSSPDLTDYVSMHNGPFASSFTQSFLNRRASTDSGHVPLTRRRARTGPASTTARRSSSYSNLPSLSCIDSTQELARWSEYTVRRSLTKFRTRKSVLTRHGSRQLGVRKPRTPSQTIKRVLENRYEICRASNVGIWQRLVAVLLCWFYSWVFDIYYLITNEGRDRSFIKWVLSCVIATAAALGILALVSFGGLHLNLLILELMNNAVAFSTFLAGIGIAMLGVLAIINFD